MEIVDTAEPIPLDELNSRSEFLVVGGDRMIVAECDSTPHAIQARTVYARKHSESAAIYRRTPRGWVRY